MSLCGMDLLLLPHLLLLYLSFFHQICRPVDLGKKVLVDYKDVFMVEFVVVWKKE